MKTDWGTLPELLTASETANVLRLRPQTLAAWRCYGKHLPFVRVGGKRVMYRREDIVAFLTRGLVGGAGEDGNN